MLRFDVRREWVVKTPTLSPEMNLSITDKFPNAKVLKNTIIIDNDYDTNESGAHPILEELGLKVGVNYFSRAVMERSAYNKALNLPTAYHMLSDFSIRNRPKNNKKELIDFEDKNYLNIVTYAHDGDFNHGRPVIISSTCVYITLSIIYFDKKHVKMVAGLHQFGINFKNPNNFEKYDEILTEFGVDISDYSKNWEPPACVPENFFDRIPIKYRRLLMNSLYKDIYDNVHSYMSSRNKDEVYNPFNIIVTENFESLTGEAWSAEFDRILPEIKPYIFPTVNVHDFKYIAQIVEKPHFRTEKNVFGRVPGEAKSFIPKKADDANYEQLTVRIDNGVTITDYGFKVPLNYNALKKSYLKYRVSMEQYNSTHSEKVHLIDDKLINITKSELVK